MIALFAVTSSRDFYAAYEQWDRSTKALRLAEADGLLTHALSQLRFERGAAISGLILEPAKLTGNLADLLRRRRLSDEAVSGALGILSSARDLDTAPVSATDEAWRRVRADLDDGLAKPVAERRPDLAPRINEAYAAPNAAVETLVGRTEVQLRREQPALSSLLRLREMGWLTRSLGGSAMLMVTTSW